MLVGTTTEIEDDDFLDRAYEPSATDLVCRFRLEPAVGLSMVGYVPS
ncbi:ribulose bisphosphate carboxylase, type III [Natrinema pellirubrum DSM 15624]|uniref:Ribulose bisphosphate carboxylase, type III n=1 Tax=Natrinema pellirubrum (strain DSM 15624 / CIP 106293 / JCM 10476 / NCIMB 786 / 157) TaxID=797303 RepID=L0JM56_NATP1|nr:ribulose bisphosphate carboxylase type III [Natrinema pellirubrum]AGB31446.1 hypothetical protein Natpe_1546 [Natrinema pellirubrum DSM 15624]ELY82001.1 ribulose bisphosphate carboxylase, type III [Natrinema pellirubrum DSM 15624]